MPNKSTRLKGSWSKHDFYQPHGGTCVDSLICRFCFKSWLNVIGTDLEDKCQYQASAKESSRLKRLMSKALTKFAEQSRK